eukprot:COSAG06_NODE_26839_length_606_cov_1.412229_1_plen_114_part_01
MRFRTCVEQHVAGRLAPFRRGWRCGVAPVAVVPEHACVFQQAHNNGVRGRLLGNVGKQNGPWQNDPWQNDPWQNDTRQNDPWQNDTWQNDTCHGRILLGTCVCVCVCVCSRTDV